MLERRNPARGKPQTFLIIGKVECKLRRCISWCWYCSWCSLWCAGRDDDVCSSDDYYSCRGNDEVVGEILGDDDKNKTKQQHNQAAESKDNGDHNAQQILCISMTFIPTTRGLSRVRN